MSWFFFIVQVNLLYPYRVIKLATQGRQDLDQWVTGYKVACSIDGANFNTVKDTSSGSDKVKISIDLLGDMPYNGISPIVSVRIFISFSFITV